MSVPHLGQADATVLLNIWKGDSLDQIIRSLTSIRNQTLPPREILIVSDGPVSNVVRQYVISTLGQFPGRYRIIETANPRGLWSSRNVGINNSSSEIVFLQDADDVMHPQRIEIQMACFLSDDVDLVGAWSIEFSEATGDVIGFRTAPTCNAEIRKSLSKRNVLCHSSVAIKKSAVKKIGGYRNVFLAEDYDLWLRLVIADLKARVIPLPLQALGIDRSLYARRGGLKFLKSEIVISSLMTRVQNAGRWRQILLFCVRMSYRMTPAMAKRLIHTFIFSQLADHKQLEAIQDPALQSFLVGATPSRRQDPSTLQDFLKLVFKTT